MPQGTRKCGCPARWCSCGGTINKSELKTKTKVAPTRKGAVLSVGNLIKAVDDVKVPKVVVKTSEGPRKNAPTYQLHSKAEVTLSQSEGNAAPMREPPLKQGRYAWHSKDLENPAGTSSEKGSQKVSSGDAGKEPASRPDKSRKQEGPVHEALGPGPSLPDKTDGDGQHGDGVQTDVLIKFADSKVAELSARKLRSRIKNQITRIRREEALLEAYGGRGDKLRPDEELQRARRQIHCSKLAIRGALQELEGIMRSGLSEEVATGNLKPENIRCAVCQSGHIIATNDILLCDGSCDRAFHQYCLQPAVSADRMPNDEESWLCPACDVKLDCIHAINKQFATNLLLSNTWKDVFSVEAEQDAAGTSPAAPKQTEWPSDDSDNEDFDPDAEATDGAEGEEGNGRTDCPASSSSDDSGDDMDDDISEGEAKALLDEAGPDAQALPQKPEERPEDLIIEGKRRRTPVDYRILNFALFGFDDVIDDSDDDEAGPVKKQRTKNEPEEPLFANDVTGASKTKEDVSTPPAVGSSVDVRVVGEARSGAVETQGEAGTTDHASINEAGAEAENVKREGVEVVAGVKSEPFVSSQVDSVANGEEPGRLTRKSRYRAELDDVAYEALKSSFLDDQNPSLERKQKLCEQLKLSFDQVHRWFRGYRHKVLTALNRPADPESDTDLPPEFKYPHLSASEIAAEEAAERDRRLNLVLKSTGKLRAVLARATALRQVARENGAEDSEADSPRIGGTGKPPGIFARLKRKAEVLEGCVIAKGKRTGYAIGESGEARMLQSTLQQLAALDTRPLSVNGNRMGRPPIRMMEMMAEVESLHEKIGGQLPEMLAKHRGSRTLKPAAKPPTLLQQSLLRGRKEVDGDGMAEDKQGLDGSDGSGSWVSGQTGRPKPRENSIGTEEDAEIGRLRLGQPVKLVKEDEELQRGGSFNSSHSFEEDESGLEDSWVAAIDKRPFSKNGKRMGRPSRQVKEAILQFRREKQGAGGFTDVTMADGGSGGGESNEELARGHGAVPPVKNGVVPRFSKSGKRIGRPPRKPDTKPALLAEALPQVESLPRSDSFGSLDGSTIGPDGIRYSKSGRRIGKPQRLGVVDPDEHILKQEEAAQLLPCAPKRMMSRRGSFDDLNAAIDHLEKPGAKVPRRERSADRLLDERLILSGIRARVASSNKLSGQATATSSGNEMNERDSGRTVGVTAGLGQEAQSAGPDVNGPLNGNHRRTDPLESLFTVVAAHELRDFAPAVLHEPSEGMVEEQRNGEGESKAGEDSLAVEQLLVAVESSGIATGLSQPSIPDQEAEPRLALESQTDDPSKVTRAPRSGCMPEEGLGQGRENAPGSDSDAGNNAGEQGAGSEGLGFGSFFLGTKFSSSSGDLAAMAASLMSPVRRPDRPPRKGGKRAFSSMVRIGSAQGISAMNIPTQSGVGPMSDGTSV